jgi:hypothetical protein
MSEDRKDTEVVTFPGTKLARDADNETPSAATVIDFSNVRSIRHSPSAPRQYCKHHAITVDVHNRAITCRDCGATVDPFDYLNSWAEKEERSVTAIVGLRKEAEGLKAEIDILKRERAAEKSKLDRILLAQNKARVTGEETA